MNLDPLLTRNPTPSTEEMQSRLDNIWERLRPEIENTATEHVTISVSIRPYWMFRKAPWVLAGVLLAAILVSALVWRHELSFWTVDEHASLKPSSQRGAESLSITVPGDAFELASVKLVAPSSEAFKLASMGENMQSIWIGCPGGYAYMTQVTPGRFTIPGASVLSLVMLAYGRDCTLVDGGPAWARSGEYYEIQAVLPQDTPTETMAALLKGDAPRLQGMLQTLLADRFRLVLKREPREMPVYEMTVATPGKMKLSPEETRQIPASALLPGMPSSAVVGRGQLIRLPGLLFGHAISTSDLAKELRLHAGRIVVDKTGRSDVFDVDLRFNTSPATAAPAVPVTPQSIPPLPGAPPQSTPALQGASLQDVLEEQLGLKLEAVRLPIEVLVIESVERPSAN